MLASVSGFQMLRFGQFWLIFEITGSPLSLGWIGLANGVPAIVLNLFGGVAADRIDQRRMVMISQSIIAMLIFFLATITLMGFVNQWHLITIAFLAGAVEAFDQPARRVLFPQLVNRKDLMSAVAMNAAIWPGTRILAPAIAGVIIAISSSAANFYVAGIGFLVMAAVTFRLRLPPHLKTSQTRPIHDILEGLHFIRKDTTFSFLIATTFFQQLLRHGLHTADAHDHRGCAGCGRERTRHDFRGRRGGLTDYRALVWYSEQFGGQGNADNRRRNHERPNGSHICDNRRDI